MKKCAASIPPYAHAISLRYSRTKHLRPKEPALRPLNNLLIHTNRRMVHDNRALLVINLGVDPRVPNQVNNPLLTLIFIEAETARQISVDALASSSNHSRMPI